MSGLNAKQNELLWRIVTNYTYEQQRDIFVEECAEGIKAVMKCKRANSSEEYGKATENLIEEVADVLIMAEQMRLYLGESAVDKVITAKLERQIDRIEEGSENGT